MGTSLENREAQTGEVLGRLHEKHPDITISLSYSNRLELLVIVMLSTWYTDERVNEVTAELFEKYNSTADYTTTDQEELADDVSSITYYNNKVKYIRSVCTDITEKRDGEVPDIVSALTDLTGVGQKTASVALQHGHDIVGGIVVDIHIQRLSYRLDLTEEEHPERIEEGLMPVIPRRDWQQFTHLFTSHERAVCDARNPDCDACVLGDLCPSSKRDHDVDLASGEAW